MDYGDFLALIDTEEKALQFSLEHGLIDVQQVCDCGMPMIIRANSSKKHGRQFACTAPRSICQRKRSILSGSFFSAAKISMQSALKCIAGYAAGLSNEQLSFYCGLRSSKTAVDWQNFFRDICTSAISSLENIVIGGPGMTVEVDESLVFKRKGNVGRMLANEISETWVFGGICRETGEAFVVPVENRDSTTLLREIQRNIAPGTRILSDCWKGYSNVSNYGYEHSRVNHSENFVNPQDPTVHTQKVERMWRTLKSIIPKGTSEDLKWTYLAEFVFKQRSGWYQRSIGERITLLLNKLRTIHFEE